jgi:hypothetical protein
MPAVPAHSSRAWPDALLDLLEDQRHLISNLAGLATEQSVLVAEGRTDALLGVLARRQQIIDQVVARQDEFIELTTGMEARIAAARPEQRERIRTLIEAIAGGLTKVMACDEADQRELEVVRDRTKQEVAALDGARQARQAYRKPGSVPTRFADERG